MTHLLILDPSLKGPGGHHFDYTRQVAAAAVAEGLLVDVAVHRAFRATEQLVAATDPSRSTLRGATPIRVHPTFRRTTYHPNSDLPGVRTLARSNGSLLKRVTAAIHRAWKGPSVDEGEVESRLVIDAADLPDDATRDHWNALDPDQRETVTIALQDLHRLFTGLAAERTGVDAEFGETCVFHTTLTELDFLAIGIGLATGRLPRGRSWSLQFHFDRFFGWPHEYDLQRDDSFVVRADRTLQIASRLAAPFDVRLFATSEPLAKQYEDLGIGPIEPLDYPINPSFVPRTIDAEEESRPARITLAGGVRAEKGQHELDGIASGLRSDVLAPGRGRLVVQRRRRRPWRRQQVAVSRRLTGPKGAWLEYVDHPLSERDYVALIRRADVGLLLYDARTYASRRAGILGEFLASGVPVIVPAACWLSDQIEQVNRRYWERLARDAEELPFATSTDPTSGERFVLSSQAIPNGSLLVADLELVDPPAALGHVEVALMTDRQPSGRFGESVVVARDPESDGGRAIRVALSLSAGMPQAEEVPAEAVSERRIAVRWAHAPEQPLTIARARFRLVRPAAGSESVPIGSVGSVVSRIDQVPAAIEELLQHRSHYLSAARSYAASWRAMHDPVATCRRVTADRRRARRAA